MGRKSRLKAQRREDKYVNRHLSLFDALSLNPHINTSNCQLLVCEAGYDEQWEWGRKLFRPDVPFCLPFDYMFIEFTYNNEIDRFRTGIVLYQEVFDDYLYIYSSCFSGFTPFDKIIAYPVFARITVSLPEHQFIDSVFVDGRETTESWGFTNGADRGAKWVDELGTSDEILEKVDAVLIKPVQCILSFLNSIKNVELIDNPPDPRLSEIHQREYGRPLSTYKTLSIKPTRKEYQNSREGESDNTPKHRLHIVRGHPRHVSGHPTIPDGTYWVRPHVRGDESLGVVVKDYKVRAN